MSESHPDVPNVVYRHSKFDILRLDFSGWESLTPTEKSYLYHLSESCLWGRDIIYMQHHRWGLLVRELLEAVWSKAKYQTRELEDYLASFWFHSGNYHSYEETKFLPSFTQEWFEEALNDLPFDIDAFLIDAGTQRSEILRFIFDPDFEPVRRASGDPDTLVERSAVNFYTLGVTTKEALAFYDKEREKYSIAPGLNSVLFIDPWGYPRESKASAVGLYGPAIKEIVYHLSLAADYAPSEEAKEVLRALIAYYETGNLEAFADYSKLWVHLLEDVDMINGFIETYTDPLGLKGSWEGIVELEDKVGTERTARIISLAADLERLSPIDEAFKREKVGAVSNRSINVVMLAGDSYPSSPLGINLPNDERIRAEEGSKSVTLANVSRAISRARSGRSVPVWFYGKEAQERQKSYGVEADLLHTDLHEGIGHASGKLSEGISGDALREFDSAIEEARADLNALYFIAHPLLREKGIVRSPEVFRALYDGYLTRGVISQLSRVGDAPVLTQAHMQNRALIGWWTLDLARNSGAVTLEKRKGKHYIFVRDYEELQRIFGQELREIQRIKSTGDYKAAGALIEKYATNVDIELLREVRERDKATGIPPFTGFVNPKIEKKQDGDFLIRFGEDYFEQNLRYSFSYKSLLAPLSTYKKVQDRAEEGKWKPVMDKIRTQLRRLMDVQVVQSLKEKGIKWKTAYGSNILKLADFAGSLPKEIDLCSLLWQTENREMRLLAIMTMPFGMPASKAMALEMAKEVRTIEEAEQLTERVLIPGGLLGDTVYLYRRASLSRYARMLPYIVATRLLTLKKPLSPDLAKLLEETVMDDLSSERTIYATLIHRFLTKMAEAGGQYRDSASALVLKINTELKADSIGHALAEDIEDLIAFMEEKEA